MVAKGGLISACFPLNIMVVISLDRIVVDPAKMNGQPCLRGFRLTVKRVVEISALFPDLADRKMEYPELEEEDYRQALHYAAMQLPDQIIAIAPDALVA
jgi:uncharacterized protein (DUF433 family)